MSPRPGSGLPDSLPAVGGRGRVEIYLVEHFFLDILRKGIVRIVRIVVSLRRK